MTEKFYYKSPIGILEISIEEESISRITIVEVCEKLSKRSGYFAEVARQLDEFFAGERTKFELNILPVGTVFQRKVWSELCHIPYGKIKSYQEVAEAIGKPNAQRAVGLACNRNPILLIIPCHRVISKSGKLTGFAFGLHIKKILLELEKVVY